MADQIATANGTPRAAEPLPNLVCPLCGKPNDCAPAACGSFDVACWCRDVEIAAATLERIPQAERGRSCICRRCAAGAR